MVHLKRVNVMFRENGIYIKETDSDITIMYDVWLARKNFQNYTCKEDFEICLNFGELHKYTKSIKKKDMITMNVYENSLSSPPIRFELVIKPDSNSKTTTRRETITVPAQRVIDRQYMDPPDIEDYEHPIVIDSSDFQKVKKMINKGDLTIKINGCKYLCIMKVFGNVSDTQLEFGEDDNSDRYSADFSCSLFSKLLKLPSLSSQIQFYAPKEINYPLLISTNIGILGEIRIFIKNNMVIENEKQEKKNMID